MARSIHGFIFDLDGTLYLGEHAIPGAVETLAFIRAHHLRYVFISNKPLEPGSAYAEKLTRLGMPATSDDVITSGCVMGTYLARVSPHARVFVIGEPPLLEEIRQAGMILSEEPDKIEYVVAAFDRTFDYRKWNIAFQAIKFHGAHFVATNGDKSCPIEGGEIPDCAGIIAALEVTTGKKCEMIVGKPSPMIIETSIARMSVPIEECLVIGDRLETDIAMGAKAGAQTALVLTGVTRRDQLASTPLQPDYVLENIGEIPRVVMKWDESS
jgi:NagD protein